jgi:hypothetical protein
VGNWTGIRILSPESFARLSWKKKRGTRIKKNILMLVGSEGIKTTNELS